MGSIPARAGEPFDAGGAGRVCGVYPRTCGGTHQLPVLVLIVEGLSPHVRGNQIEFPGDGSASGSIPARAGEPECNSLSPRRDGVYPRTCGGTLGVILLALEGLGLSPHVRGNLGADPATHLCVGSIPARAGEPCCSSPPARRSGVYPRTCGGTLP